MKVAPQLTVCPQCGTEIGPRLLTCPACQWLVHSEKLKQLAAGAESAAKAGKLTEALAAWRLAQDLLPDDCRQYAAIQNKITLLSRQVDNARGGAGARATASGNAREGWRRRGGVLGTAGMGLIFLLTKGKLLLLGLSQIGTLFSMLVSLEIYGIAFGWPFAIGLIASTYVHEMGHVAALARYGIQATAPMFIPGFGAVVRLRQYPSEPREDARVGLAGPWWGAAAALAAHLLGWLGGWGICTEIAVIGALINLFNLVPVGPLDGGRGFRALSSGQRMVVLAAALALLWAVLEVFSGDKAQLFKFIHLSLLVLLVAIGAFALLRAFSPRAPQQGDRRTLWHYLFLLGALVFMALAPAL